MAKFDRLIAEKKITSDSKIVYIDDGSTDKTLSILEGIAEQDKKVKVLSFSRNF